MKPMNQCSKCGANLDPCERCDCEDGSDATENAKKGLPHANDASPQTVSSYLIISQVFRKCNNPLRFIREDKQVPASEIVNAVKQRYPKYDKTLQSKCESTNYGVCLEPDALVDLLKIHAPELLVLPRKDTHRRTKSIRCRLTDTEHETLMSVIAAEGFATVQGWLENLIHNYLHNTNILTKG